MTRLSDYYKYEKEQLKTAGFRILLTISLLWFFITTASEASSAAGASLALQSVSSSQNGANEFSINLIRFALLFSLPAAELYRSLFYIKEQKAFVPVLAKYCFAPVDIRKMRRAKILLLIKGTSLCCICYLIISFVTARVYLGSNAPYISLTLQSFYALLFSVAMTGIMIISERLRYRYYISHPNSRI